MLTCIALYERPPCHRAPWGPHRGRHQVRIRRGHSHRKRWRRGHKPPAVVQPSEPPGMCTVLLWQRAVCNNVPSSSALVKRDSEGDENPAPLTPIECRNRACIFYHLTTAAGLRQRCSLGKEKKPGSEAQRGTSRVRMRLVGNVTMDW